MLSMISIGENLDLIWRLVIDAIILAPHNITENIEHQMIYQTPLFPKFDDIDNRELEDEIYLEKKNCSGISAFKP